MQYFKNAILYSRYYILFLLYLYIVKKQKIKNFLKHHLSLFLFSIFFSGFFVWVIFASVVFSETAISPQTSVWTWSYNSEIEIKEEWASFSWAYYVNKWNDSAVIWNYFRWYYYDSVFWFFKLDWSSNPSNNVRVYGSTNKCSTWYWYKLAWKAESKYVWFIDFAYNSNAFVYYCLDDNKLYGKAYWKNIWYQNFEWISLELIADVETLVEEVNSDIFINDDTSINEINPWWAWSNAWNNSLGWDIFHVDDSKESIFYIIK